MRPERPTPSALYRNSVFIDRPRHSDREPGEMNRSLVRATDSEVAVWESWARRASGPIHELVSALKAERRYAAILEAEKAALETEITRDKGTKGQL